MASEQLVCGIDLGGTKINGALVRRDGSIVGQGRTKTLASEGADAVIGRIVELVDGLCREAGFHSDRLRAISIGVPGGVDDAAGVVDRAPNLGWTKVPLARRLSDALGCKRILLDNDVRVAVLGE